MMSKWLQLHSYLRERGFLWGKITIPFEFAQVFFSVYQQSRFNKYWLIVFAKCHYKTVKQTYVCKTQVIAAIAENSPVLSMRSAVYGPAHVSLTSNSELINFPATVSHDYRVISLALNNIFPPKN